MTDCGCRVEVHMANVPPPTIAYCLLHAQAEAMREYVRQCADGRLVIERRGIEWANLLLTDMGGQRNATG